MIALQKISNFFNRFPLRYNLSTRCLRQSATQNLIYRCQPQRLINSPINLKYLVPSNIFEQQATIEEYEKIKVNDKSHNHFQNSYLSINLNVGENGPFRNTLIRYDNKAVRIGRLLEIMDMIGALVSYRHCFGSFKRNNPFTLVTGAVQSLEFFQHFNTEQDIHVQGFLNNTGRTSMQIEVNITQGGKIKANSYFTMVSRNSNDLSKGMPVPQLDISRLPAEQISKAQLRRKLALEHIQRRKKQINESFDVRPPNEQQIKQIHQIFLSRKRPISEAQIHKNQLKISQTYTETNGIMHLQDRNIHGKIFGGFLMREMLQIGWVAGMKFLKGQQFEVQAITDMYFLSAVEVGDGLTISAAVTYTQGTTVIITVQASTNNFNQNSKRLCCTCQLILQTKSPVQGVYPCSYEQAIEYLNSRRTFGKLVARVANTI